MAEIQNYFPFLSLGEKTVLFQEQIGKKHKIPEFKLHFFAYLKKKKKNQNDISCRKNLKKAWSEDDSKLFESNLMQILHS